MALYLVAIHHPDKRDPSSEDEAMVRDIDALNAEMIAAGVRLFAGGLQDVSKAKSLHAQANGEVLVTDGPYMDTKEHVAGFWLLETADMDQALTWARKAVFACRAPVEVRAFFRNDDSGRLRSTIKQGKTLYMATIQLPDNFVPPSDYEAMARDIDALNEEMEAAGVMIFAGGLHPASSAKSLRAQPNGEVLITDGPYMDTKEHVGGVSLLEANDMDEALSWARRGAVACRASGEVRAFFRSSEEARAAKPSDSASLTAART